MLELTTVTVPMLEMPPSLADPDPIPVAESCRFAVMAASEMIRFSIVEFPPLAEPDPIPAPEPDAHTEILPPEMVRFSTAEIPSMSAYPDPIRDPGSYCRIMAKMPESLRVPIDERPSFDGPDPIVTIRRVNDERPIPKMNELLIVRTSTVEKPDEPGPDPIPAPLDVQRGSTVTFSIAIVETLEKLE
jgi:hypothetical protein